MDPLPYPFPQDDVPAEVADELIRITTDPEPTAEARRAPEPAGAAAVGPLFQREAGTGRLLVGSARGNERHLEKVGGV